MEIDQLVRATQAPEVVEAADSKPPHEQYVADESAMTEQEQQQEQQQEKAGVDPIITSLHLSGVDDLSTQQIKKYLDYHIKPNYSFTTRKQYAYLEYRLDWINDSEINIVFDYNLSNYSDKRTRKSHLKNNNVDLLEEIKGFAKKKVQPQITEGEADEEMKETSKGQEDSETDTGNDSLQGLENESIRGAAEALLLLTDFEDIRQEHGEFAALSIEDQFKAVDQAPKLQDRKCWDLVLSKNGTVIKTRDAKKFYNVFERVMQGKADSEEGQQNEEAVAGPTEKEGAEVFPEDTKIIKLEVRYSTELDKKVENARVFSRYYLLHGEPDKIERLPPAKERFNGARPDAARYDRDLITAAEPETQGLFGYDGDRDEREVIEPGYRERENRRRGINGRWSSDRFPVPGHGGRHKDSRISKGGPRRDRRRAGRGNGGAHGRDQLEGDLFPDFAQRRQQ
ncbi:hypothetical protein PMKS-002756 [Pichia membranifaciens]|uniref:Uncharacterized protein n=1 Tax=Pichia membranifaciens TaxID=4926 RepID=A0A1Q2YIA4_9ASCO|nr:hypothetical protein PMKS-002756 [Pichia membranifaciens]